MRTATKATLFSLVPAALLSVSTLALAQDGTAPADGNKIVIEQDGAVKNPDAGGAEAKAQQPSEAELEGAGDVVVEGGTQVDDTGTGEKSVDGITTATTGNCQSMLDELDQGVSTLREQREKNRDQMAAAATKEPLILAMADGSFVYVGGEEELSEPYESWFVSEQELKRTVLMTEQAKTLMEEKKDAECVELLQQASAAQ